MISLRKFQSTAVTALRSAYSTGARAPLFVAPTGSGKTVLFSYIAAEAATRGNRTLILVHRKELLHQTSRTLADFDVEHGLIAAGLRPTEQPVQVASVQTLVRRLAKMTWTPDLIVVDEAHHATMDTSWGRVLSTYDEVRVLGVTATPERLDGKGLGVDAGGFFDRLVMGPSVSALVSEAYLSPPVVFAPSQVDLSGVRTRGGDWKREELNEAMDKPKITGDALEHYQRHCPGEPALCFCVSIEHAEHVAEEFRAAGIASASIDGTLDDATRAERIADLANGQIKVLTSCEIVSEGTDIPVVSAAILLRPTQSTGLYLQQVGRALRPFPGKQRALILDHVGNCMRHGLPDDDRDWTLAGRKRTKSQTSEAPVAIRQCKRCFHVHRPAPECPRCGFEYPAQTRKIEQVDGDLAEVNRKQLRREQGAAKSLDELKEIARVRGYKPQWAVFVHKARMRKRRVA